MTKKKEIYVFKITYKCPNLNKDISLNVKDVVIIPGVQGSQSWVDIDTMKSCPCGKNHILVLDE